MKEIQEEEEENKKNKTIYPSLNPKDLKNDKNIFESICKQRKMKIEYSMFMMPGAKSKLIFWFKTLHILFIFSLIDLMN